MHRSILTAKNAFMAALEEKANSVLQKELDSKSVKNAGTYCVATDAG